MISLALEVGGFLPADKGARLSGPAVPASLQPREALSQQAGAW